MYKVDLNSDIGESFGAYTMGADEEIIKSVSSVNVACGYHAGDPMVMERTVQAACAAGTMIGAHPGYPDLMGFGRHNMMISPQEAKAYVMYQMGALWAFVHSKGACLQHCKPHGALYNMAAVDLGLATAICEAVMEIDHNIIMLVPANSKMAQAAGMLGLRVASEVFADRAYMEDGTLVARKVQGAVIQDEADAIRRTVRMVVEGKVETVSGRDIEIQADSICVHGDHPQALHFVKSIRKALMDSGVVICNLKNLC
ncbi:MAG: 5-oxoprolinase subunit PxpA [Oscillospiraceae bacterium]